MVDAGASDMVFDITENKLYPLDFGDLVDDLLLVLGLR